MAAVGTLESAAKKRQERLRALREKKGHTLTENGSTDAPNNDDEDSEKLPRPIFRSYRPQDERLKEVAMDQIKPAKVEEEVRDQLESAKTKHIVEEVDLLNLAPRKPDWDLKRDIAPKLEKLERRTQRAIAELIRERLKASQSDLATVVNASEAMARADDEDDDD